MKYLLSNIKVKNFKIPKKISMIDKLVLTKGHNLKDRAAFMELISSEMEKGLFSACQFNGGHTGTFSFQTTEKINSETPFDIASITKIVLTAPLFYSLFSKKELSPDTHVRDLISGFKSEVTVFELLSHISGFQAWLPFYELAGNLTDINDRKKAVTEIIDNSKRNEKTYLYSDLNYILLGFILEKVHGKNLDKIFDDFKKENCISSDITFNPVKKVPSTAFSKLRNRFPEGTVEDENCYYLGGMTGHAGLFASAAGTVSYFKTLLGKEWFMKTGTELDFAGFDRPSGTDSNYGKNAQKNLIGHLGFTGTAVLIDPETENVSAFFTNSTHPSPEKPDRKERLKRCRQLFFDSCF